MRWRLLGVLLLLKVQLDVRGLLGLAASGVAMVVVFGVTLIFFVYRNDPYLDLRAWLPRLRIPRRV